MTHETRHAEWEDRLAFYAAGTLSPAERAALEQHLAGCPACRAALESWRGIGEIVAGQVAQWARRAPPLSGTVRARLSAPPPTSTNGHSAHLARLDLERTLRGRSTPIPPVARRWGLPLTMAAALAGLLVGALVLFLALNSRDDSARLAAPVASVTVTRTTTPTPTPRRATEVAAVLDGAETPGWDLGILPTYTPAGSVGGPAATPIPTRCTVNVIGGSPAPVYQSPDSASPIAAWLQPGVFYLALRKTDTDWLEVRMPDGALLGWVPGARVARFGACDLPPATSAPAATPTAQFGSSIGGGYNLITRERIGAIPQGARVRISHAWYEGGAWMYFIVQDDELTTAEARQDQLALASGYDPSQPTPTARFGPAIGMGGNHFILLEAIDDIPAGEHVSIGSAWYDGAGWWYDVHTAEGATAQAREDQLGLEPGYDPLQPTPTIASVPPTSQPTAAPSPTLPPGFTQWAEAAIGVRFDYPSDWYVVTSAQGLATAVTLTTYDPASPPPMAAWGPGTLEMTIAYSPAAPADLLEWVEAERAQLTSTGLEVFSDEAITLPGERYEGWELVVFSGAGHSITNLYTEIAGQKYQIWYTGDSDLAASVIATLRSTR